MPHLTLLLIGDIERPEFCDASAAMRAACRVVRASSVGSAADWLDGDGPPPDLIVLAQVRPGEHAAGDLQRLRRGAALAPVVALLGPWSEGEMRSGEPLPDVVRVYWHQWLPQFTRQVAMFEQGVCPAWGLPPTATDEERLLWSQGRSRVKREGVVAIVAERFETVDWLADACAELGLRTIRAAVGRGIDARDVAAVLWDMLPGDGDVSDVAALRETFGEAPIVVMAGFPRVADHERLLAAGAAAVLSKPLLWEDLVGLCHGSSRSRSCLNSTGEPSDSRQR
ncbi:MAG TPA: hypothetical protein VMV69_00890 [Pirellulales bacterium]|nr:hypothetical protein [Pirellulales bacterium]